MPDFEIRFEWEESPRARAPELAATWARLEILGGGKPLTKVEVERTQSIRDGIYVPLYPIAEWMIANWWFLWHEWRADYRSLRHSLAAAREGFALPDITFLPTEQKIELAWRPCNAPASGLRFLAGGEQTVSKPVVQQQFQRLIEGVIERLRTLGVDDRHLDEEWGAILEAEQDPGTRAFCERAARLGQDPFELDDATASRIEQLDGAVPESVLDDLCDAVSLDQIESGAHSVKMFIQSAGSSTAEPGRWLDVRNELRPLVSDVPYRQGYNDARALRSYLGVEGPIEVDLPEYLTRELGSCPILAISAPRRIEAISLATPSQAPVFGLRSRTIREQERFSLCRAIGDSIAGYEAALVTRGRTEHQQRNRAFAAEFLAPAESVRGRLPGERIDDEDIEELALEFGVSDFVIRHQIENHDLVRLNG